MDSSIALAEFRLTSLIFITLNFPLRSPDCRQAFKVLDRETVTVELVVSYLKNGVGKERGLQLNQVHLTKLSSQI